MYYLKEVLFLTAKRRLTSDDLYRMVFVSDPQLSPDGKQIAYVKTGIEEKTKEYRSTIWIVPADGSGKPRPFTSGPKRDTSPRWSPDGTKLAFVSDRTDEKQIWIMETLGGEALQLTTMRRGASGPSWSPDSKRICFTAPVNPEDPPDELQKPLDEKAKEAEKDKNPQNR